ncbi:LOW QUALITY PROTEIN: protein PHYTOCHROME KINASE SUBSTRATE 4-like [Prosopis cineraria]|uniref:LOW QUALITY PROTEIN: protein PHYTOCHROME KINASE SUBSTRATE 4-like n=1 Tax=Prosopis cineraria TaxID=364024 RepID=UPI00240FB98C|nr:LOW QUALITY PROTEIN: protein PHYTOCHROME KINASE SUBSTRATE 4-like [Prosopis cineraria]
MERTTVMKTFHGNLISPKSPALRDRDASFSSYLRPDEAIGCQRHLTIGLGGCRALDDSELSIFDAHKYFNEATNNDTQKVGISNNNRVSPLVHLNVEHNPEQGDIITEPRRYSSASSFDGYSNIRNYRARSFHAATPTASSEASWNSQTGLLSHPPGAISVSMRNPPHPTDPNRKFRDSLCKPIWLFRRKCPCSGKKSVEVKENTLEHKTQVPQTIPPPPPRLSHSQMTRDSLNLKRHDLDGSNLETPIDKFTMNMEKVTAAANNPETQKIPIPIIRSSNWVDQRPLDQEMIVAKSQRYQSAGTRVPAILQPQRFLASARPFTDGFTFPVLKPQSEMPATELQNVNEVDEDPPRESLEVFRPADIELDSVSRKADDRGRQNFPFPPSPVPRIIDDDVASDASSDLFEIESFSTQTTSTCPIMYRRRDSPDDVTSFDVKRSGTNNHHGYLCGRRSMDSTTPTITECYEPSEASIDWSVTTAEGFDRASAVNFSASASEIADDASIVHGGGELHTAEKWKRKGSSGNGMSLLSCRSEKAVSVGPKPMKAVKAGEGQKWATKCIASSRHEHVSSRVGTVNNAPHGSSHTARVSLPYAT